VVGCERFFLFATQFNGLSLASGQLEEAYFADVVVCGRGGDVLLRGRNEFVVRISRKW
jgi:hypothetical protein